MPKSVNIAIILGNLTRDPELKYTPKGTAVVTFAVATNRSWVTSDGTSSEAVEFHNVVAWNKLAELCSQYLYKGRPVYIKGRIQTRSWEDSDGKKKYWTEIVADDIVFLGASKPGTGSVVDRGVSSSVKKAESSSAKAESSSAKAESSSAKAEGSSAKAEDVPISEVPF